MVVLSFKFEFFRAFVYVEEWPGALEMSDMEVLPKYGLQTCTLFYFDVTIGLSMRMLKVVTWF